MDFFSSKMLHEEQFDVLNKTITSMYTVRVCSDIKIKLNLARKQKNVNPAFKMIFDIGPQQAPHKKGLSERLTFYKERPDWSTLMPSLVCRFLSSMYRLSRLSTLLGIFKSDQIWDGEYTSSQSPPRCHRCSAWCSPCTGCQTSFVRKKL